jgi:D-sedoheptulose 7-phosphate isomerase
MISSLIKRYPALKPCEQDITRALTLLCDAFSRGNKLLVCGNGGSAADAEHIVGELMKGFRNPRPLPAGEKAKLAEVGGDDGARLADRLQSPLPALSLVSSVSLATAFANDVAPEMVFAQQVYGLGVPGDVLLAISTSGTSTNVAYAVIAAKARGLQTIGLSGGSGGRLKNLCEVCIVAPSSVTHEIQEYHVPVYHCLCAAVEQHFFGPATK